MRHVATEQPSAPAITARPTIHVAAAAYAGVLLGAGSYGRVYKGRWHNTDVAVKVMEHNARMAAVVANEASLMMSFNHPVSAAVMASRRCVLTCCWCHAVN